MGKRVQHMFAERQTEKNEKRIRDERVSENGENTASKKIFSKQRLVLVADGGEDGCWWSKGGEVTQGISSFGSVESPN